MKGGKTILLLLLISLFWAFFPTFSAEVGIGTIAHIWGEYPSGEYGFLNRFSYTIGPLISFATNSLTWDFWYGTDPIQNGWIGQQLPPIDTGEVKVQLHELGWRTSLATPLFLSASYSRLRCTVTPVPCNEQYVAGGWVAHQLTAGGGLRFGRLWALAEAGVRWWDWVDIPTYGEPFETALYLASGFTVPTSSISATDVRHGVDSLSVAFEETFPLTCDEWEWEGQAGRITTIEEQLSIQVKERGQRVMQRFCCEEGRFVLDVDISPFTSYNEKHFFGVVLRYEDDDNFYAFEVRADGYVRFTRVIDGVWETLADWQRTVAYDPGEKNHLRVIAPGNRCVFYLNDRRVLRVREVSFLKGDIGLFAGTTGEPGTWVFFDNLTVRAIPPNTLLDPRSERTKEYEYAERFGLALLGGAAGLWSFSQGYDFLGFIFTAESLYELFSDSTHLIVVE